MQLDTLLHSGYNCMAALFLIFFKEFNLLFIIILRNDACHRKLFYKEEEMCHSMIA